MQAGAPDSVWLYGYGPAIEKLVGWWGGAINDARFGEPQARSLTEWKQGTENGGTAQSISAGHSAHAGRRTSG